MALHEEDVSSSHVDTDKPLMSINPSLTYSVAGVDRDMASNKQENVREEEYKRSPRTTQMRPAVGQERPNHPRVS